MRYAGINEMEFDMNEQPIDAPAESELTVPISHLSLEPGVDVPIDGWQRMFDQLSIRVVTDVAGRPAISSLAARRLFAAIKRQAELRAEDAQRRSEKLAKKYPVPAGRGLPAIEGASAIESLVAAGGVVTPEQEFGGRPRPNFLQEELAAGEQAQAEKQRIAAERAKDRLTKQMQDRLR